MKAVSQLRKKDIQLKKEFDAFSSPKKDVTDLALFGGTPAFYEKLHVGRPNHINRIDLFDRMNQLLDRNWLTNNGPFVKELEQKIVDYTGVRHCIAMSNATIALEITIRGLDLEGEVIVPSMTFIATAHSLQWQKITPVFCDIDPRTLCIDPERVEQMITPKTTGIIGVNLFGRPCAVDELDDIARRHNLKLIFDSAHAFGCTYKGKMIGGFGNAEIFSFHATKFFNTAEGGAVLTNDDELAQKIRLMKNFGFADRDKVIYIGTNGKMSELSAAVGLTNFDYLEQTMQKNRENYLAYKKELQNIPGVTLLPYTQKEKSNYQYIVLLIDEQKTKISRDDLLSILTAENVLARRYFYPGCHRMEPYKSHFPHAGLLLPNTEKIVDSVLSLPTGTSVNRLQIQQICDILRFSIKNGKEIRKNKKLTEE